MKSILALGLAAALSAPALAAVPLFDLGGQPVGAAPSPGTSAGIVVVDNGLFTGFSPSMFDNNGSGLQIYVDSQGTDDFSGVLGSYNVPFPPVPRSISYYQYGFTVASTTTFSVGYNMLTNLTPGTGADFFAIALIGSGGSVLLAEEDTRFSALAPGASDFGYETGVRKLDFTVAAGSYTAEFLLGTSQAGCLDGGLCIPTGVVIAAIPEPGSYAMLLTGLLGVAWVARRRRNG